MEQHSVHNTYWYKLIPTPTQERELGRVLGLCRWLYNTALEQRIIAYRRAIFDYRTDTPSLTEEERAPENAILLFDGVFLLRPEINDQWDYRVFVEVPFAVTIERAILRDRDQFGSDEATRARYEERYIPGQELYLKSVDPLRHAQAILNNEESQRPTLTFLHNCCLSR